LSNFSLDDQSKPDRADDDREPRSPHSNTSLSSGWEPPIVFS